LSRSCFVATYGCSHCHRHFPFLIDNKRSVYDRHGNEGLRAHGGGGGGGRSDMHFRDASDLFREVWRL
jgi:DnaJ-class molecular chaperone